ncbi:hypothetical protein [Pseudarthrobacter sp. BIM B-2242]|uniref:hypothetical protein n=1 Tax=Pseudarthrobacter sp. BIM B-2242 TaxID=2772401 RepID=UPI00168AFF30|nr:hypothetical protein [Pseudarthrobacter sp. BIM B-2242]QOD05914.1 hypothetical protein IDT60_20300 [Pseudarthrobacter sp. BIM B-2242]
MSAPTYEPITYPSHQDEATHHEPDHEVERENDSYALDLDDQAGNDAEEDAGSAEENAATGESKARNQAKANRAVIRKTAAKAIEVNAAPESTRVLAATLLGCSADPVDLATAIMSAPRASGTAVADLDEISVAIKDAPWEAGVTATALERGRQKDVWALLHTLDAVGTPTPPQAVAKAGLALVKAIASLSDESKRDLADAGELIKRS